MLAFRQGGRTEYNHAAAGRSYLGAHQAHAGGPSLTWPGENTIRHQLLAALRARTIAGGGIASCSRASLLDAVLVGVLVAYAVAVRLPDFMLVPRLTDETEEVLIGFRVYQGQALPLVGINTYIGSLFSYVVAGVFAVVGPRPEVGRLTVLIVGALGVIPTYLLGRAVGGAGARGRLVGLAAAALLAASATDILITSRLAYSNSFTPFFTTLGLWLLHRAVRDRSGSALAWSGLVFGLAFQTHMAAVVLWPGLAVYLAIHRHVVSLRWLLVAAVLGVAAVANIIVFNVINPAATLDEIVFRSGDYGGAPSAGLASWPDRIGIILHAYALGLGGFVTEYIVFEDIYTFAPLAYTGLALVGLAILLRRRAWLLPLAFVAGLLMISLLNARLEPVVARSRHYAQLLPLGYVLVAVALVAVQTWLARRTTMTVAGAALVALTGVLVVASQLELQAYVAERLSRPDKNNLANIQAVDAILRGGPLSGRVYIDRALSSAATNSNRRGVRDIAFMLTIRGQDYDSIDVAKQVLPMRRSGGAPSRPGSASRRMVLSRDTIAAAAFLYRLVPLPGEPGEGALVRAFRAYAIVQASP